MLPILRKAAHLTSALSLALVYGQALHAEPISIFGLDWSQEPMRQAVENRGYSCAEVTNIFGGVQTICKSSNKEIIVDTDVVTFGCNVFNGCGYSLVEIAQSVVNEGVIKQLSPETETISDGVNTFYIEKYCGRGDEGDVLCVVQDMNLFGQPIMKIELSKGQYGQGGMNFN